MSARPVVCYACGEEWDSDPRLSVPCPVAGCHAGVGAMCLRPSGHRVSLAFGAQPHQEREQLAMDRGFLRMCSAAPREERTQRQGDLFGASGGAG